MSKRLLTSVAAIIAVFIGFVPGLTSADSAVSHSATSTSTGALFPTVPSNKQVSISVASYLPAIGASGIAEFNSLVSGFNALHPNIHVTAVPFAGTDQAVQVQQDEVAGTTPDVAQVGFSDLKFMAKQLGAVNLSKVVGKASLAQEFGGTYNYAPSVAKLADVKGSTYAIPWTLSTPVLFYNEALFSKAGLNPQDPPATWDQLKADALQIKTATGAAGLANGCIGTAAGTNDWCLQGIIESDGGSVMNSSQTKLTFDEPKTIAALETMQGLASAGVMPNLSSAQITQSFSAGQLAMILSSSALTSSLVAGDAGKFQMAVAKMPSFGTGKAVPTSSGSALFMMSKSKLAQEADWELMEYLTDPSSETSITENVGYAPLRPSIVNSSTYLQSWANANQFLTANMFQLEHIHPWLAYPGPNYLTLETVLLNAASNVIFQNQSPLSTMQSAQSQGESLLH